MPACRAAAVTVVTVVTVVSALAALTPPAFAAPVFPDVVSLPTGFQPEGIASGPGTSVYVGSIPTGAIWRGDLRTGDGAVVVPARSGRAAIGVKVGRGLVWAAGGGTGKAFVYDAETGADVATLTLTTGATFVNDVVLTREAAWFTDSVNPVLYRVDRTPAGAPGAVTTVPISGDLVYTSGFNVNGIAATPDGATLVVVQSNLGRLFTVDPATGRAARIDLGGEAVPNGDGILLDGTTLYVVQNRLNRVAAVALAPDLSAGTVGTRVSSPGFDVPTTITEFGGTLYAVNARFGTPSPASASYTVVAVPKP